MMRQFNFSISSYNLKVGAATLDCELLLYCDCILVVITGVTMTTPTTTNVKVIAGSGLTFQCVTSGGLPTAVVRWYKNGGSPSAADDILLDGSTDSASDSNGLKVTTSQLFYTPSIQDQNCRIFCEANNTVVVFSSSLKPVLDVQCKFNSYLVSVI